MGINYHEQIKDLQPYLQYVPDAQKANVAKQLMKACDKGMVLGDTDGSYVEGYNTGKTEGYTNGVTDGYSDGYMWGRIKGQEEGKVMGYEEGYAEGYTIGYADGEAAGGSTGGEDTVGPGTVYDHNSPEYLYGYAIIKNGPLVSMVTSEYLMENNYLMDFPYAISFRIDVSADPANTAYTIHLNKGNKLCGCATDVGTNPTTSKQLGMLDAFVDAGDAKTMSINKGTCSYLAIYAYYDNSIGSTASISVEKM